MQHNKYLDDLGIPIKEYGLNWVEENDDRNEFMNKEKEKYSFDPRECWNLDDYFQEWLYSRLMKYLEDASKVINLDFYKFNFNNKEYTQKEAIQYIIECVKNILLLRINDVEDKEYKKVYEEYQNAVKLFADILPYMWW